MTQLRDRAADLIGTIERLRHAIETENKTLSAIGTGIIPQIDLDTKRQLAAHYAEQMKDIQERLKGGDALDRATSDLVAGAHQRLSEDMRINRQLLRRTHTATSRMVSLIVDTARENMPKKTDSYFAPSQHQAKVGHAEQSLALNVTL